MLNALLEYESNCSAICFYNDGIIYSPIILPIILIYRSMSIATMYLSAANTNFSLKYKKHGIKHFIRATVCKWNISAIP